MWLAVTDGWQAGSIGMTAAELAAFLGERGAYVAIALDGGSSSALVVDGALISSPSDGVERTVANHSRSGTARCPGPARRPHLQHERDRLRRPGAQDRRA